MFELGIISVVALALGLWKFKANVRLTALHEILGGLFLLMIFASVDSIAQTVWRMGSASLLFPLASASGWVAARVLLRGQPVRSVPEHARAAGGRLAFWLSIPAALAIDLVFLALVLAQLSAIATTYAAGTDIFVLIAALVLAFLSVRNSAPARIALGAVVLGLLLFLASTLFPAGYVMQAVPLDQEVLRRITPDGLNLAGYFLIFFLVGLGAPAVWNTHSNRVVSTFLAFMLLAILVWLPTYYGTARIAPQALGSHPSTLHVVAQDILSSGLLRWLDALVLCAGLSAVNVLIPSILRTLRSIRWTERALEKEGQPVLSQSWEPVIAVAAVVTALALGTGLVWITQIVLQMSAGYLAVFSASIVLALFGNVSKVQFWVATSVGLLVYGSAIAQKSPGDPALWSVGILIVYYSLSWLVSKIKKSRSGSVDAASAQKG